MEATAASLTAAETAAGCGSCADDAEGAEARAATTATTATTTAVAAADDDFAASAGGGGAAGGGNGGLVSPASSAELVRLVDKALASLVVTDAPVAPEQIRDVLLSIRSAIERGRGGGGDGQSFVEMVDVIDIDSATKNWLSQNYTQNFSDRQVYPVMRSATLRRSSEQALSSAARDYDAEQGDERAAAAVAAAVGSDAKMDLDEASVPRNPSSGLVDVGDLTNWDWDIFAVDSNALYSALLQMFSHFNFMEQFKIPPAVFSSFVSAVRQGYPANPFHNFHHGVDVCQTVFSMLTTMGGARYLTQIERMAVLTSALVHDIQHPGLNNAYQVNAGTELALLYNDQSVLEHHHCATAFRLLQDPRHNIFCNLSRSEHRSLRNHVTNCVLATDMTRHFAMIERFTSMLEKRQPSLDKAKCVTFLDKAKSESEQLPIESEADRMLVLNIMLHSADISNPTKPWAIATRWSDYIVEEFFNQGDIEQSMGLPVSPNCNRDTTDTTAIPLNFIDFIVAPIFVSLRQLLPNVQHGCVHLRDNRHESIRLFHTKLRASSKSAAEKEQEEVRWQRRTDTFNQILLPTEAVVNAGACFFCCWWWCWCWC